MMVYEETAVEENQEPQEEADDADLLAFYTEQVNLIPFLDEEQMAKITSMVMQGLQEDESSEAEWVSENEEIHKLLGRATESKTYPWPDASNVKYPMILSAALQFNARAYPTIVNNGNIALAKIIGADPDSEKEKRAQRVSKFMSFQVLEQMDEWDGEMDKMMLGLPIDGCAFKKVYYDPESRKSVSDYVLAVDLVINSSATSLATCMRYTHLVNFYPNEIDTFVNMEIWEPIDIQQTEGEYAPEQFCEQHTYLDLDEDDTFEPYLIIFHKESGKVVRIVANYTLDGIEMKGDEVIRVQKRDYFVKYECFPDPSGGFKGKGFGQLLKPLNDSFNSILNQLIDAGHLSNTGGGFFAKSFRGVAGTLRFSPGEWKKVDTGGMPIKDAIVPLPIREPSNVLFSLLGMLDEAGKSISSVQDVMTGGGAASAAVGTTLALIEQGMKVYTSIFKRIYRSFKKELRLLYILNGDHLTEEAYLAVLDDEQASLDDFAMDGMDILPAADPNMATDIQRNTQAQALMSLVDDPRLNGRKILENALRSLGITDPDEYIVPPPEPGSSPAEMLELAEANRKQQEADAKTITAKSNQFKALSDAVLNLQKTEAEGGDAIVNVQEMGVVFELAKQLGVIDDTSNGEPVPRLDAPMDEGVPNPQPQGT